MRGATHLLFGLLLATILTETVGYDKPLLAVILVLLGSLLPDVDEKSSLLGRKVPLVGFFVRHRSFFHSILFLVALIIAFHLVLAPVYVWSFALAYALHLVLDAMTPAGVTPFWPSDLKVKGFVRVGGVLEKAIFVFAAAAFVWLLIG